MLQSVSQTGSAPSAVATATPRARSGKEPGETGPLGVRDSLELSSAAKTYAERSGVDTFRPEKVAEVRAQIEAGNYLTDEKLNVVVDRLCAEILGRA